MILGRLQEKFHFLPGSGMGKAQKAGPKGDLTRIFPGIVLPLAHQGHPSAGKLHPDLVGSAGVQANAHLGQIIPG